MLFFIACAVLGMAAGFFAGFFGVGGGLFLVPFLVYLFEYRGFDQSLILHMALGTAMGTILFTSLSSMRAHHKHNAVRWPIVRGIVPGVLIGTFFGTFFASKVPTFPLAVIFVTITFLTSLQILIGYRPAGRDQKPGRGTLAGVGVFIGAISSLVSAGGGFLTVPFMLYINESMHKAVGTSAAIGFPIAFSGVLGYAISGYLRGAQEALPAHSIGYIYLPALFAIIPTSMLCAPLGARLSHALPVGPLKKAFAILMMLLGMRMLWKLL